MVYWMSGHEFMMSLGVRHPDIDPAQITAALGLQPGHVWRKGEPRMDRAGGALEGCRRESYWLCELTPRPRFSGEGTTLESEMAGVLQRLRKSIGFMQQLHHGGGVTELHVTVFARGDFRMELLPDEAALLGRIGVSVNIEVKAGHLAPDLPSG